MTLHKTHQVILKLQSSKANLDIFIGCITAYGLIFFRHGYSFGSGDQSEFFAYSKFFLNPHLYPKDFYIQSIAQHIPNERYFFSKFFSWFGGNMEVAAFCLHCAATVVLAWGLYRLAQTWLTTEGGRWMAVLAPILLLYNINLGGNELYYNLLAPSYLAQAIGVWIFVFILEARFWHTYPLLLVATFLHPLIGLQLWVLVSVLLLKVAFQERTLVATARFILPTLAYAACVSYYIFILQNGFNTGEISNSLLKDIIELRAAHHYFPNYFPLKSWLILLPIWAILYLDANWSLRLIIRTIVAGLAIYTVSVLMTTALPPLSSQWFLTTVWLKTFAIIFVIRRLEGSYISFIKKADTNSIHLLIKRIRIVYLLAIVGVAAFVLTIPSIRLFKNKPYEAFFFTTKNAEKDIALQSKSLTPTDALFVIPPDVSAFRYWSERSSYVDFKAIHHSKTYYAEWYKRVQAIYNIKLQDRRSQADLMATAQSFYQQLSESDLSHLAAQQGVTHILTYKNHFLNFKKVGENDRFCLYAIEHKAMK